MLKRTYEFVRFPKECGHRLLALSPSEVFMLQKTVRFILDAALLAALSSAPLVMTQAAIAASDPALDVLTFPLPTSVPAQNTVRIDGDPPDCTNE